MSRLARARSTASQVIKVCDEIPCCKTPLDDANLSEIFKSICGGVEPESASEVSRIVVQPYGQGMFKHALVSAVHTAWVGNYPLVLTPDVIWTAIQQGCAHTRLVHSSYSLHSCSGITSAAGPKLELNSSLGTISYWPDVFEDFAEQIKEANPSTYTPSFSTSGPQERAVANLSLMNACVRVYNYSHIDVPTYGIPAITVTGTRRDWTLLRDNALALVSKFRSVNVGNPGTTVWSWNKLLKPVLDQFISAASGEFDQKFWRSIYHCTSATSTGWIFALFPCIQKDGSTRISLSKYLSPEYLTVPPLHWDSIQQPGIICSEIPSGIVTTDETYNDMKKGTPQKYKLHSGFIAVSQDKETMAIHPEIGWVVSKD